MEADVLLASLSLVEKKSEPMRVVNDDDDRAAGCTTNHERKARTDFMSPTKKKVENLNILSKKMEPKISKEL